MLQMMLCMLRALPAAGRERKVGFFTPCPLISRHFWSENIIDRLLYEFDVSVHVIFRDSGADRREVAVRVNSFRPWVAF